jgi:hypothetical protein
MSEVMTHRDGFGQILIETQGASDRPCELTNFEGMGEPRARVISEIRNEDLRLVFETAESARVEDAVAVTLKCEPEFATILFVCPPTGGFHRTGARQGKTSGLVHFKLGAAANSVEDHRSSASEESASSAPTRRKLPATSTGSSSNFKPCKGELATRAPGKASTSRSIGRARSSTN